MMKKQLIFVLFPFCLFSCSGVKNTQDGDNTADTEMDGENYCENNSDEIGDDEYYEESIIYDPSLIESLPAEVKEGCVGITDGVATNIDGDLDKTFTIETITESQDVIYDASRKQFSEDRESYTWKIGVESIVINSNPYEGLEERVEEIFTDVYKYKGDAHELTKYVSPKRKDSNLLESDAKWLGSNIEDEEFKNCMIMGPERDLTLVGINRRTHYQNWTPNHTCAFINYAYFEKVDGVWYVVSVR